MADIAPLITNPSRLPGIIAPALGAAPMLSSAPVMAGPSFADVATMARPSLPAISPVHNAALDTPVQQAQANLNHLQSTGSGIDQIKNPFVRGIAKAGDIAGAIAGSVFAPLRAAEALIPGTNEHHDYLVHKAQAQLGNAQASAQASAQLEDSQAQAQEREALATQEKAKAEALLHPKPTPGHLLISGDGSAAGYQDADGNLHGLNDPTVPQGARDVAGNMAGKPAKVPLAEQPLDAAEAQRLNGLWDNLADKHHLPKGQFTAGMTRADATTLASGLNNVVGKQQGDTHVSISMQGMQNAAANQAARNTPINTSDPATASAVQGVASGKIKLSDVFGRGATTAQKAAFVAAVQGVNPNYNSGDHDIENHIRNYMIAGKGGQTLTAFNTAQTHLDILRQASDALQNGNNTAFNGLAQQFAKVSGSPAPTDFNAVKNAVKGEVSRALTGNVTVSEQAELDKDFNNASSPRQIAGVAKKYMQLIDGKKQSMRDTYNAGQSGQVNFGGGGSTAPVESYVRVNGKLVKQ